MNYAFLDDTCHQIFPFAHVHTWWSSAHHRCCHFKYVTKCSVGYIPTARFSTDLMLYFGTFRSVGEQSRAEQSWAAFTKNYDIWKFRSTLLKPGEVLQGWVVALYIKNIYAWLACRAQIHMFIENIDEHGGESVNQSLLSRVCKSGRPLHQFQIKSVSVEHTL